MINSIQSVQNYFGKFWVSAVIISVATKIMVSFFGKLVLNAKFVPPLLSMFISYLNKLIPNIDWIPMMVKIIGKLFLSFCVNFSFLNCCFGKNQLCSILGNNQNNSLNYFLVFPLLFETFSCCEVVHLSCRGAST